MSEIISVQTDEIIGLPVQRKEVFTCMLIVLRATMHST